MTILIAAIVGGFFLFIILRLIFSKSGRPGGTDSSSFPYDNNLTSIPPPSWSPDSGSSNNTNDDAQCEASDGGWGDSSGDGGSCDSGGGGGD